MVFVDMRFDVLLLLLLTRGVVTSDVLAWLGLKAAALAL